MTKESAMQAPLFCAACEAPLVFDVPELANHRWYAGCAACGKRTSLEAIPNDKGGDRATFRATGVLPKSSLR